jgi:hypothetical protein
MKSEQPSAQLEYECPGLTEWWPEVESDAEEKKSRRWSFATQVAVPESRQDAETEEAIAWQIEEGERWIETERRWREATRKRRKRSKQAVGGWGGQERLRRGRCDQGECRRWREV